MSETVNVPKVKIAPLDCYVQAFTLVQGHYWLLVGVSAVAMLLGGAAPLPLIGPMMCGLYICFLEKHRGREIEFKLLFDGFDHFVPSLIASLIMTGVSLVIIMPGFFIMFAGIIMSIPPAGAGGGQAEVPAIAPVLLLVAAFVLFALLMVASAFFMFTFPLIVDRKLTGPEAIGRSVRAVAKNFWGVMGLTLIGIVVALVGALACYVGTFFLVPISIGAMTIAYRKVFPEIVSEAAAAEATATPEPPGPVTAPA